MAHYAWVHDEKRFVAVFSPRCGCTTIKDWFRSSLTVEAVKEHDVAPRHGIRLRRLEKYRGYRRIFFIRNPFARVVSFYCGFVVREKPQWCFADDAGQYRLEGKTFAELIGTLAELARRGEPFQHHLQPQLQGVESVAFDTVIPIEHFDSAIGRLNRELGIAYEPRRLNATRYDSTRSGFVHDRSPREIAPSGVPEPAWFYDERLAEIVADLYRDDLTFYDRHSTAPADVRE